MLRGFSKDSISYESDGAGSVVFHILIPLGIALKASDPESEKKNIFKKFQEREQNGFRSFRPKNSFFRKVVFFQGFCDL